MPRRHTAPQGKPGVVIETVGRRVLVRDAHGERTCFLAGKRAVIGDRVQWVEARGEGGKLVVVEERDTALVRMDMRGKRQVLAANLGGLLIVISVRAPDFRRALLDRYLVAASVQGLQATLVLTKTDLGIPDNVTAQFEEITDVGVDILKVSNTDGSGVQEISDYLAKVAKKRPWALVGGSGVGKTSLVGRLLPGQDVGAVGEISEFWGTGRHTTTTSRLFDLPGGGIIADSPGIRNLTPAIDDVALVRENFPIVSRVRCKFRDCLHREDEEGCNAPDEVSATLLASYRHLLNEVTDVIDWQKPG
ncbi:MAG: ribosome biogenesis GTPase [Myxococcota bacterium]